MTSEGGISEEALRSCLTKGWGELNWYADVSIARLTRIAKVMAAVKDTVSGPTLDVASARGLLFPFLQTYLPNWLPYHVTSLHRDEIIAGTEKIQCLQFECDKDRIPVPDDSYGCVLFFDVLEHLLVDPMWTLFEFNRVLKPGGCVIISTPNAISIDRANGMLQGRSPFTEHYIKPGAIYERHNREWSVGEVQQALELSGFTDHVYTTFPEALSESDIQLHRHLVEHQLTQLPLDLFGPHVVIASRKAQRKTLDDPLGVDERWPAWLYTHFDDYRKRPSIFPINSS